MADVPSKIDELVEIFDRNIDTYRSQAYNETQLRREFIDPFFEELGWDVTNKAGLAQAYKDVIHEDAIKVGGETKAPDYCFRIGGVRKFFLEAKKPSVNIKGDPHPAYQLRRYAWSAKLPLSILTNFEEFAVYDCLSRPKQTDGPRNACIFYFNYKDYPDKWHDIADIFSKDAILKGSFDKFAVSTKTKRGTTTVDTEFLAEIESWRKMLAQIIALRNRSLSARDLNFAVQRTIDRILFLRMCEDRGIEPYGQLRIISNGSRNYPRLCEIFEKADQKYNSGLFHFHDEPNRAEPPDELTLTLEIDDKDLKWILHTLYYPLCPYEFSVLPPEILGNVYEQFLGKIISITPGRRAKIEPKPEVKKAGGVYYTPSYIVDYIVKNTVGKLLGTFPNTLSEVEGSDYDGHCEEAEGRRSNLKSLTPKQIADLKILDPACGSGSFLLGAYTYLLNYHLDWYINNDPETWAKKKNPPIYQVPSSSHSEYVFSRRRNGDAIFSGDYKLTVSERKRILLNNIFGVDIDLQAVEVTKLSLLLKVLEGENSQTLENQYRLFHERALPDLANNIKCGNSLIGPDFFDTVVIPSAAEESVRNRHSRAGPALSLPKGGNLDDLRQKINPFDWQQEFPQIFSRKNPGFDAVIGNPPYDVLEKDRTKGSWPHSALASYIKRTSHYDSALGGKLNLFRFFIVKSKQIISNGGRFGMIVPLALLADISCTRTRLHLVRNFSDILFDCFPQKDIPNRRVFLNAKLSTVVITASASPLRTDAQAGITVRVYPSNRFVDPFREANIILDAAKLLDPAHVPIPLVDNLAWTLCLQIHGLNTVKRLGDVSAFSLTRGEINQTIYRPCITPKPTYSRLLKGVEIARYCLNTRLSQGTKEWFDERKFLSANKPKLISNQIRIATQRITGVDERLRVVATLIDPPVYFADSTNSVTIAPGSQYSLSYLLGILNSKLTQWRFKITSTNNNVGTNELESLPFRTIDFDNPDDKAMHDKMVKLVERTLDLHKKLSAARIPDEKTRIQREITATDSQIDKLVYELYNLTEEEIKLVEGQKKL